MLIDVPCTACGCVCDDLRLSVSDQRVTHVAPGCPLAEQFFARATGPQAVGESVSPTELAACLDQAATILSQAHAPLIYGLSHSSTPAQQAAVALADRLGASIDTNASTCHAPSIVALQVSGESTCTLGEIRNRADVVVYWGSNPLVSHPRHVERFVDAPGMLVPRGRQDRHVIVVDIERTATADQADIFIQVQPGRDFELAWALRSLVQGHRLLQDTIAGVPRSQIEELALRLQSADFGALFFGLGVTHGPVPHLQVEALLRLVTDLHRHTRWVARRMRIPGDVAGADSVLCWQTGYPFSVHLGRGYPRYNPGEFSANELLSRNEVDAMLVIGTAGINKLSTAALKTVRRLPTIVLNPPYVTPPWKPTVHFETATYGIHRLGTAYRMDETPLPLRPILNSSLPADHEILQALLTRIQG
ncbi:MAG: formylmethanofuran dehydrogenase subunit B [Planctomycetaceae bacterium]|nr:formylmethanofuran dehydrogenase subunit B [Planctomycetaceae bacterium]